MLIQNCEPDGTLIKAVPAEKPLSYRFTLSFKIDRSTCICFPAHQSGGKTMRVVPQSADNKFRNMVSLP